MGNFQSKIPNDFKKNFSRIQTIIPALKNGKVCKNLETKFLLHFYGILKMFLESILHW